MSSMLDLPRPDEAPRAAPARATLRAVPDVAPPLDFEAVVRRLTPRLQRYATRRLGDRHEAEELVQEALLRAYHHREELRTEDDVAAWSTCVTGRLVIDRLRVRGRSTCVAEFPDGTRVGRDTAEVVVARAEARLALDALDAMPPRQAAVLWAREVEGLGYGEIGTRFRMTPPAVRSVLSRARKSLRKEFATRGGTLPAGGLIALAPWLDGLSWLDRLRRVAGKAATPAVLGIVGLGVLGGTLMTPWSSPDVATAPQPTVAALPAHEIAVARASIPTAAVAPTAASTAQRVATTPAAPAEETTAVDDLGINDTCAQAAGARAGGVSCNPEADPALLVGVPLPENPTGIGQVGVENNKVDCTGLPTLPFTQCTSAEGDNR